MWLAKKKQDNIGVALLKMLKSMPSDDVVEETSALGINAGSNADAVAAALLKRALKGEVSAVKEVNELTKNLDIKSSKNLSKLYEALGCDEKD